MPTYPYVEVRDLIWLHMISPKEWLAPIEGAPFPQYTICADPGMCWAEQAELWNNDMVGQEPKVTFAGRLPQ